ncbi:unnamed protein product [Echinostoma caproni]|uniref:CUB domain-containing protein n=1 Tax=Echinostoma caproni TaxID=27848 RepID=A0A183A6R2_9TREM|nr:unnamed protein product [Echinostoma caproni]
MANSARAPSKTERIVLDFRGPVVFEPSSNCENDYLEIRDGQYGFSPLVGRFCTDSWQLRPVVSTGPWLWLRLQTDYTIEKSGFQAVYYFEPNRPKPPSLLTVVQHTMHNIITLDTGALLTKSNLTQIARDYAQTLEGRPSTLSGIREFIFDFRTIDEDMILRIHLETIKFPIEEGQCRHNMIEMYGRFFLSDTPKSRSAGKSYSRLQLPPDSRVIRACKMASRSPILYRLGRAVVRIVATSSMQAMREADQRDDVPKHSHLPTPENTDLPEVKLLATALTLAPCRPNWFPCMRVTDLLNIDRQLNATGDSVLNVLMRPEFDHPDYPGLSSRTGLNASMTEAITTRKQLARRRELVGDSVYCVAISRLCNQLNDCPNGEDEDDCPRPRDSLKDILQYYADLDTTHTGDVSSTTTPSSLQSKKEREEAEDEFHHHPSIIIGLLGFCAICGLLSAGMTLVNRGKQTKQRNFSSICNRVLFDSGTSLLTTLEEGSVLQLKTRAGESVKPNLVSVSADSSRIADRDNGETTGDVTGQSPSKQAEAKSRQESNRCFGQICLVSHRSKKRKRERTKSDPGSPSLLTVKAKSNGTDTADRRAKESCSSADLVEQATAISGELESRNLIEVFDRATIPLNYASRDSAVWDESPLPPQSDEFTRDRNVLRRKVQSGELISRLPRHISRSSAASFGHLPNTIVCPVEKLSDVIYHCGMLPPGSSLNRNTWNRSGPLPLVTEPESTFTEDYLHETLKATRSAKCLTRRSSTDRHTGSAFEFVHVERSPVGEETNETVMTAAASASLSAGFSTLDSRTRIMVPSSVGRQAIDQRYTLYGRPALDGSQFMDRDDMTQAERRVMGMGGKRKSFKGGAPKRARYSIDPSNEPGSMINSAEGAPETSDYGNRQANSSVQTIQTPPFWTSSCSTSGELLTSGQSSREISRGWRKSPSSSNQPNSRAPYWSGHVGSTKIVLGPSGTPSEDVSLADLNEAEVTPKLIYRCESSSLGSHLKICRSVNASTMDETRIPIVSRSSNKPEALFKVTVMPKCRGSQSSDLRMGDGVGIAAFGTTPAQSDTRRTSGPPSASVAPPLPPTPSGAATTGQIYCDCALQSNDLVYRSQPRTPHRQMGSYTPVANAFPLSISDHRKDEAVPELDDSEDTATQNYSEETESGTYSDERLPSEYQRQ